MGATIEGMTTDQAREFLAGLDELDAIAGDPVAHRAATQDDRRAAIEALGGRTS